MRQMGRCGGWVDILNKVLAEVVGRTAPADSELTVFVQDRFEQELVGRPGLEPGTTG